MGWCDVDREVLLLMLLCDCEYNCLNLFGVRNEMRERGVLRATVEVDLPEMLATDLNKINQVADEWILVIPLIY